MPPFKASEGFAQIMHFLVASPMDGTFPLLAILLNR